MSTHTTKWFDTPPEDQPLREKVYNALDKPLSSKWGFLISIINSAIIIFSAAIFVLIVLYDDFIWYIMEVCIIVIWTLDYLTRFVLSPVRYKWVIKPLNVVDLLSILPFYIELATNARVTPLGIVRSLRILRLVRVFKMRKYKPIVKKLYYAFLHHVGWESFIPLLNYALYNMYNQMKAVVPIFLYILVFPFVTMGIFIENIGTIIAGVVALIVGLFLFIEGLKYGLMPMGEFIGKMMPLKRPLWMVLLITFIIGIIVTLAEPSINILEGLGVLLPQEKVPYLAYIIGEWDLLLLLFIGIGVGAAGMLSVLRSKFNWRMKDMIFFILLPAMVITVFMMYEIPELNPLIGLAWDCGVITTGPVAVPMLLVLGLGVSNSNNSSSDNDESGVSKTGLGIVTLASIVPVLFVQFLAFIVLGKTRSEVMEAKLDVVKDGWYEISPGYEFIISIRAILPLVIALFIIIKVALKEKIPVEVLENMIKRNISNNDDAFSDKESTSDELSTSHHDPVVVESIEMIEWDGGNRGTEVTLPPIARRRSIEIMEKVIMSPKIGSYILFYGGLVSLLIGMLIFNYGITYGWGKLATGIGKILPGAFLEVDAVSNSPRFNNVIGIMLVSIFTFFLGFLAARAEPALQVLGNEVESFGEMSKKLLMFSVSFGVGMGLAVGVLKFIFDIPLIYFILVGYSISMLLSIISNESLVCIAWDSAGVTTGPITVPFILTFGVALGSVIETTEVFGMLTLSCIGPIISVLISGLCYKLYLFILSWRSEKAASKESSSS